MKLLKKLSEGEGSQEKKSGKKSEKYKAKKAEKKKSKKT